MKRKSHINPRSLPGAKRPHVSEIAAQRWSKPLFADESDEKKQKRAQCVRSLMNRSFRPELKALLQTALPCLPSALISITTQYLSSFIFDSTVDTEGLLLLKNRPDYPDPEGFVYNRDILETVTYKPIMNNGRISFAIFATDMMDGYISQDPLIMIPAHNRISLFVFQEEDDENFKYKMSTLDCCGCSPIDLVFTSSGQYSFLSSLNMNGFVNTMEQMQSHPMMSKCLKSLTRNELPLADDMDDFVVKQ